jgi:hypothetical protein
MFARVAAAEGSSLSETAETARKHTRRSLSEYSAQHLESAQAGTFALPRFSWNIGNVALHAPNDCNEPSSGEGGRSGATQYTGSLPWPMQAKLEVGAVEDPMEREAERMAEHVMRMPDAGAVAPPDVTGGGIPGVQRKCSCGGMCARCSTKHAEDEHGEVLRKTVAPRFASIGSMSSGSQRSAPPIVQEVLHSPGESLPAATRAFFEPKFAHDLSRIRVHADDRAAESARAIQARAYTVGHNIVFGPKQYQPGTVDGRRLLAHELTHSIQQSAGSEMGRQAGFNAIRNSAQTRVMCAPPTSAPPQRTVHPSVMQDIQAKFEQLYAKLSPQARYRLYRNITIAIGVVTEESDKQANSPRWVYTLSGNASSKEIDAAAEQLGLTRWKPSPRTEGRGTVGAPNDAEQLLTEGAEANHFDVWAAGVNRRVCADCQLHLKDVEVPAQAFPDKAFSKGGSLYQYQPPSAAGGQGGADPSGGASGAQEKQATPQGLTGRPTQPKAQGGTKPSSGTGAEPGAEHEGGGTTPAAKTTGPAPQAGRSSQVAIQIGTGIASLGLAWLAAYLKARVDQRIAERQIDAFLDLAKKRINANPDEALKKMMIAPEATTHAWVYLDSAVITTFGVDPGSPEPSTSASSPIINLSRIDYQLTPVDQSLIQSFPTISGGGRHITMVSSIVIDIPLTTPPLEDLISYAKARNLPLDDLHVYALGRYQAALSSLQTGLEARQRILAAYQTTNEAFRKLQADFEIAKKRHDVELRKFIAEKLLSVSEGLMSIAEKLAPIGESIQKFDQKLKYWERILNLVRQAMPHP